jgi:hypothetical protein
MGKEVTMEFSVEQELQSRFLAAAQSKAKADQVLREFMSDYIARTQDRPAGAIAHEERERRREAVEFAQASVALEGLPITAVEKAHAQRFINGEIDLDRYVTAAGDASRER